jgi:hypothetical protein
MVKIISILKVGMAEKGLYKSLNQRYRYGVRENKVGKDTVCKFLKAGDGSKNL